MKKLIVVLLSLVYIVSGIVYADIIVAEASIQQILMNESSVSYLEDFKEVFNFEPVYEMVPVEYQQQAEAIVEKISEDKQLNAIFQDQGAMALEDLINGTMSFDELETKKDIMNVVDNYAEEVEVMTQGSVTKDEIVTQLEQRISGYNLVSTYEKVLVKVRGQLSDSQLKTLSTFNDTIAKLKTLTLYVAVVSVLLVSLLSLSSFMWSSLLGLILLFVNRFILNTMFDSMLIKFNLAQNSYLLNYDAFSKVYLLLGILFVLGLVSKIIKKRKYLMVD